MSDDGMQSWMEKYDSRLQAAREGVASKVAAHLTATRLEEENLRRLEAESRSVRSAAAVRRSSTAASRNATKADRARTRAEVEQRREQNMRKRASLHARRRQGGGEGGSNAGAGSSSDLDSDGGVPADGARNVSEEDDALPEEEAAGDVVGGHQASTDRDGEERQQEGETA